MDTLFRDLRLTFRSMRKRPLFFLATWITLALGIGGTVALFDIVRSVVLQQLPYPHAERLVTLYSYYPKLRIRGAISPPDFRDYRTLAKSFAPIAATAPIQVSLADRESAEQIEGLSVSADFFRMLGVEPFLGRSFLPQEEQPGHERVTVLSYALWSRRFAAQREIVGQTIRLNRLPYVVVGVMPPDFRWGRSYGKERDAEIWTPLAFLPGQLTEDERGSEYLDVYARLSPQATLQSSRLEMDRIHDALRRQFPQHYPPPGEWQFDVRPMKEDMVTDTRPALVALLLAAVAVLILGCCNVSVLQLSRMSARRRELLVRSALGASRSRLMQQLLTESIFTALLAGMTAPVLSIVLRRLAEHTVASQIPRFHEVSFGAETLWFAALLSVIAGVAAGIVPAIRGVQESIHGAEQGSRMTHSISRQRAQKALMAVQMVLTLVLLAGAGLFVKSFIHVLQVDPGFDAERVLTFRLSLPAEEYPRGVKRDGFYRAVRERISSLPGVISTGMVGNLPMTGDDNSGSFLIEGTPMPEAGKEPHADWTVAATGYFSTLRIPLKAGRTFSGQDSEASVPVAIINERMARMYWPDEDPLGKRFAMEGSPEQPHWRTIVGVVGAVKQRSLEDEERPQFYIPYGQMTFRSMTIVVRSALRPDALLPSIREVVREIDPDIPVYRSATMEHWLSDSTARRRTAIWLILSFAALALLLAILGIYGMVSYSVTDRTQEIGIRRALGSGARDILKLLMSSTLKIAVVATLGGLGLVAAGGRLLSGLLFGVESADPSTMAAVVILLILTVALSSYIPARRALQIDPAEALRYE